MGKRDWTARLHLNAREQFFFLFYCVVRSRTRNAKNICSQLRLQFQHTPAFKQTMLIIVSDISADFRLINIQWTDRICKRLDFDI